jgi:hypothetical protein
MKKAWPLLYAVYGGLVKQTCDSVHVPVNKLCPKRNEDIFTGVCVMAVFGGSPGKENSIDTNLKK